MLIFIDGFDSYAAADLAKKGYSYTNTAPTLQANGRRGTNAISMSNGGTTTVLKSLSANYNTLIAGIACSINTLPSIAIPIFTFTASGTDQISVCITGANGLLAIYRGYAGTLLATSNVAMVAGAFRYLELKATLHGTTGTYELRVDGVSVLTASGVNTITNTNAYANQVRLGYPNGGGITFTYDDFYICDTTGTTNNDFLGDVRIDTLLPNADGTYSQFTPNSGTVHYSRVADTAPDTATYNAGSAVGQKDTYAFQDLSPVTGTIKGVQVNVMALKDDAGARSIAPMVKSGSTELVGTATALSTSQTDTLQIVELDPATGLAWTEAGVNSAEAGVKIV